MSTRLRASAGFLIACFLALFAAVPSRAQGGFTTVTGTITDPNGIPYSCGTISATLVTPGGTAPTLNGLGFSTGPYNAQLGCPIVPGNNVPGSFIMRLADLSIVLPSGCLWRFTVNIPGEAPPLGFGPQSFTLSLGASVINGASVDISGQLSVVAPPIALSSVETGTGAPPSNIRLVQTPGTYTTITSSLSGTQTFTQNVTTGNTIIVMVQVGVGSSGNTLTVTDSQSDCGTAFNQAGSSDIGIAYVLYCPNVKGGSTTVTVTFNASSSAVFTIAEYSGILKVHPVQNANGPNGSASRPAFSIFSPTTGGLLVVEIGENGTSHTYASFIGCAPHANITNVSATWCDNTNIPQGLNNYSFMQSGATDFILKAVIFLPSSYSPPVAPAVVRITEGSIGSNGNLKAFAASPVTDIFAGGNQTGNCIVAHTLQGGTTNNITGVTDTEGNTYTALTGGGNLADSNGHTFFQDYIAPVTSGGLGNNTITVTLSSGQGVVAAEELSGTACAQDANATGNASYTLTNTVNADLVLTDLTYSGGGVTWSNLSGTDLFGTPAVVNQNDVNFFQACQTSGSITSTIAGGTFAASFSVSIKPATPSAGCSSPNGPLTTAVPAVSSSLWSKLTGTCTSSSTLGFYNLGQTAATSCTSTVLNLGQSFTQNETVLGIYVSVGTGGVNASSGVVTIFKNGVATPITCTVGTTGFCSDFTHGTAFFASDVISAQVTTQAAETLANVVLQVVKVP